MGNTESAPNYVASAYQGTCKKVCKAFMEVPFSIHLKDDSQERFVFLLVPWNVSISSDDLCNSIKFICNHLINEDNKRMKNPSVCPLVHRHIVSVSCNIQKEFLAESLLYIAHKCLLCFTNPKQTYASVVMKPTEPLSTVTWQDLKHMVELLGCVHDHYGLCHGDVRLNIFHRLSDYNNNDEINDLVIYQWNVNPEYKPEYNKDTCEDLVALFKSAYNYIEDTDKKRMLIDAFFGKTTNLNEEEIEDAAQWNAQERVRTTCSKLKICTTLGDYGPDVILTL